MKKYYQAIQAFHEKFKMKGTNNEDMQFRLNLIIEELGELAQAITKGKPKKDIVEENVIVIKINKNSKYQDTRYKQIPNHKY